MCNNENFFNFIKKQKAWYLKNMFFKIFTSYNDVYYSLLCNVTYLTSCNKVLHFRYYNNVSRFWTQTVFEIINLTCTLKEVKGCQSGSPFQTHPECCKKSKIYSLHFTNKMRKYICVKPTADCTSSCTKVISEILTIVPSKQTNNC